MKEYEERAVNAIGTIDPSLELIKIFPASTLVCKVKKENSYYILKVADYQKTFSEITNKENTKWSFNWKINHLKKEKEILKRVSQIKGITHLVKEYIDFNGIYMTPILKEYYEGKTLRELGGKIQDSVLQKNLERTVRSLLQMGIANLDIRRENVVLNSTEKEGCIIEIGGAKIEEEIGYCRFKKLKGEDIQRLDEFIFE
jgi:serine/threonine protein kinase